MKESKAIDGSYVRSVSGAECGNWNAHLLYYRNIHPSRKIRIFVKHHWIYDNQSQVELQQHVLEPSSVTDPYQVGPEDVKMGCPIPGPTTQKFNWDVYDAKWES